MVLKKKCALKFWNMLTWDTEKDHQPDSQSKGSTTNNSALLDEERKLDETTIAEKRGRYY